MSTQNEANLGEIDAVWDRTSAMVLADEQREGH